MDIVIPVDLHRIDAGTMDGCAVHAANPEAFRRATLRLMPIFA